MKGLTTAIGAGALLLAIAACGQTQTQPGGLTQTQAGNGIAPAGQGGSLRDVPAAQVDATRLPAGDPKRVQLDDNGTVLTVQGVEGACSHVSAELASQEAGEVHVVLVDQLDPPRDCPMWARTVQLTVQLDKPLADRKVVLEERTVQS